MKNLTIRQQLLILTIIPIIGFLYLSFNIINTSNNEKKNLLKIDTYLSYTIHASKLIHSLQIERGLSSGFLESKGIKFREELPKQRIASDDAYQKVKIFLENNTIDNKEKILQSLESFSKNEIEKFRIKLDNLQTNSHDNIQYFSTKISKIIDTISFFQTLNKSKTLSLHSLSYINLILAKENAGQERAVINSIILSKKLITEDLQKIIRLSTSQLNHINVFKSSSSNELVEYYNEKLNNENTKEVDKIRLFILSNYEKFNLISQMKSISGYGGLIHNFKNFLLRKDSKYQKLFEKNYLDLVKYIHLYKKLPQSDKEKELLNEIQSTFSLYKKNIERISLYHRKNINVNSIDKIIKIDDEKAINAFDTLSNNIVGIDVYTWFNASTKRINALNEIENKIFSQFFKEIKQNKRDLSNDIIFQLAYISVFLFIIIILSIVIYRNINTQINSFQNALLSFFQYINKEKKTYTLLDEKANNEFGQMSRVLNKGINNIASHIELEIEEVKQQEKRLFEANKITSLGQLIDNIAHQWRQPLSVISTGITGMRVQKEYNILEDKDFYKNCDVINDNVQYLSKTINSFQNFIEGNSKKTIFNIKENIQEFLSLVDGSIKEHDINIITNIHSEIDLNNHANELIQSLLNIFNNAKDAFLGNNIEKKILLINTTTTSNQLHLHIRDNAGGIDKNIIENIFEPYSTTKHKSQGTGLGLHMTYALITDAMRGTIQANNVEYLHNDESYLGAEFIITLPLS